MFAICFGKTPPSSGSLYSTCKCTPLSFSWRDRLQWPKSLSLSRLHDHTQTHHTR